VLPGLHVNGRISLGENISDLGGLTIEQRFFLGWAQFFRIKARDEYLRQTMRMWRHSPDMQRVWTVRNIDAWYEAFDVEPGEKLYLPPEKRVRVW
jgi:putative endopeptidase